jgi:hypothetical protein
MKVLAIIIASLLCCSCLHAPRWTKTKAAIGATYESKSSGVVIGIPAGWSMCLSESNALYSNTQWSNAKQNVAIGVVYIESPIPLSADLILSLARQQYRGGGGVSRQWRDDRGRRWFEGADDTFHGKAFVVTSGGRAWVVYSGYRLREKPDRADISAAEESAATVHLPQN